MIGYHNDLKDAKIYAIRAYNRALDENEKAQNHFVDIAKWFKLDVSKFAVMRDEFPSDAVEAYYKKFADFTFDSNKDEVQAAADAAYKTLSDLIVYPEFTLDYYNDLYFQTNLITAFDVMAFNKFWGKAVNDNAENVDFPTSPMYDENYKGTYADYNGTVTEGEYPTKETWDFTEKAKITYEGQENVEIPYYKDRFDPRARDASGNIVTNPEAGKEYEYHIMQGNRGDGVNGFTGFSAHTAIIADDNTYYSLEAAYEACLAKEAADTTDRYEYWIVGDDTSEAYRKAIDTYKEDTDKWYAQYVWRGSKVYEGLTNKPDVSSDPAYGRNAYSFRLAWSLARYDFAADPTPGTGYLLSQYPYVGGAGLYYIPGTALTAKETVTLETVINVSELKNTFIILHNQRPTISGSKFVVGTGFVAGATTVQESTTDFVLNKAETFRFVVSNDITVGEGEAAVTTDRVILEQGAKTFYDATGTYTYGGTNMIGYSNSVKGSKIYALRVYRTDLTSAQKNQNNFVDVAKWYRLDITGFENFSEDEKQIIYTAFKDYDVDMPNMTRAQLQAVYDAIPVVKEKSYLNNLLEFDGYQAKLYTMPGIRSTYSISKASIKALEDLGYKVTVGAMMSIANQSRSAHEDLVIPEDYGEEGFFAEGEYSKILNGVAYQEVYNTEAKTNDPENDKDGIVGEILSEADGSTNGVYKFAYTTTYKTEYQTLKILKRTEILYRGFVVLTDIDSGEKTIAYADMGSQFDTDGDAIAVYDLYKYFYDDPAGAYNNCEQIKNVINVVAAAIAPENYYPLYVQDGLFYHMNFASATADMQVTSDASDDNIYAADIYGSVRKVYENFLIGKKDGLPNPWSGGTATVANGGWKFISPYGYDFWFKEGNTVYSGQGGAAISTLTIAPHNAFDFVEINAAEGDGNQVETTIGYAWDGSYVYAYIVAKDETPMEGDTITLKYQLKGTAPEDGTDVETLTIPRHVETTFADEDISYWVKVNDDSKIASILIKVPAKATEDGAALAEKDPFYTALEIVDARDTTVSYSAIGAYDNYVLGYVVTATGTSGQAGTAITFKNPQAPNMIPYRIIIPTELTDTDGDGVYTASSVFFDGTDVPYHKDDSGNYILVEFRNFNHEGAYQRLPVYFLEHTAPDWATNFYITSTTWGKAAYSSSFENGRFDAGAGNTIYLSKDLKETLAMEKKVSVELTAASTVWNAKLNTYEKAAFFIGPRFELTPTETYVSFPATEGVEMIADSDSGYSDINMNFAGNKANTYSFTFDLLNEEKGIDITKDNFYLLEAYGNGTQENVDFASQKVKSQTQAFGSTGEYVMRGPGIKTYAVRVYTKVLSADEVSLNHFVDIAIFNQLDVGDFKLLGDDQKIAVSKEFTKIAVDEKSYDELQTLLDAAVAAQTAE